MEHKRIATALLVGAVSFGTFGTFATAQAQEASAVGSPDLAAADQKFVETASMSNSTEIDASKLAQTHSNDKDVRTFARKMIMDHTKLMVQMKMGAPKGVKVPKDDSDTGLIDKLKNLKGKDFDTLYIQQVALAGHKKAVAAFQDEIANGTDAKLKAAAQKALPTIQGHYEAGQKLAQSKGISE